METIIIIVGIILTMSIGLGVGSSTIAIINFFVAISDGTIDPVERKMMGAVYVLLRIAMVLILTTLLASTAFGYSLNGMAYFTPQIIAWWILVGVLFGNAILMTKRIMPSNFGPAIQAGSWYTLGLTSALASLDITLTSTVQFLLVYITVVVLAVSIVNAVMAFLKKD